MASKIEFEVKSHVDEFMDAVVQKIPLMLKAVGQTAEGYAKEDCPVDTGLLRNSITYAISGERPAITSYSADKADDSGVVQHGMYDGNTDPEEEPQCYSLLVGSNVKYAPAQEMNDNYNHTVGKAHFLRDAMQNHRQEYKEIIEAVIMTIPYVKNTGGGGTDFID